MPHPRVDDAADVATARSPAPSAVPPDAIAASAAQQPLWTVQYRLILLTVDLCAIILATILGFELRFGAGVAGIGAAGYLVIGLAIAVGWAVALQASGGYEIRHIATGPEELKRVLRASGLTLSVLAIGCYVTKTPVARGYVIGVIPLGAILIICGRAAIRRYVNKRRNRGEWVYRILAVGTADSVTHLLDTTNRARNAGLRLIGACVEDAPVGSEIAPDVPVLGGVLDTAEHAARVRADVVAVTGSGLGPRAVRELGWQLEGTNRGLVMAPALTEIAGSRVHVSPVEGLPLVWLEQPQLGRLPRIVKRSLDIAVGSVVLLLASPVLLGTALAIKFSSRGPVFFRQRRLGINGTEFNILKFRSMYSDAESRRDEILELNEQDGGGVLFKIRRDPRITPVGRWLRKLSIDELPQLVHVVSGTMSLVGPRPLAAIDSHYTGSARRRLLVRPGVTGLWQISGRSETTWEDAVRFDLYYVENWSLGLDLSILFRTVIAVLGRKGAF
ncbi:sugar transferase [uncultured Jatrophihabitans sp.]|uniref:sugar transferase n=1 Tax=uncultured Jatrophihabitans sp. TaxID=1610747 RepID=UPI0035CC1140